MAQTNLILLGPPGSGKGTQGERLTDDLELPYWATGDILRAAVREGSDVGKEAQRYMDAGDLVPDEVMVGVIAERIDSKEGRDGFILDGFPRTLGQAEALDSKLAELDAELSRVILIDVTDEEVQRRLGGRRVCSNGHVFHAEFSPPEKEGVCDVCGEELIVRDDDKPDVIEHRLGTYHEKTEPLVAYYEDKGLLARIDGTLEPDEVAEKISRVLATAHMESDV